MSVSVVCGSGMIYPWISTWQERAVWVGRLSMWR